MNMNYGRKAYKKARYKKWRQRMKNSWLKEHPNWKPQEELKC